MFYCENYRRHFNEIIMVGLHFKTVDKILACISHGNSVYWLGYRLDNQSPIPGRREDLFDAMPRLALGFTQLSNKWEPDLSPGVKQVRMESWTHLNWICILRMCEATPPLSTYLHYVVFTRHGYLWRIKLSGMWHFERSW